MGKFPESIDEETYIAPSPSTAAVSVVDFSSADFAKGLKDTNLGLIEIIKTGKLIEVEKNIFKTSINLSNILKTSIEMSNEIGKLQMLLIDWNNKPDSSQFDALNIMMLDIKDRLAEIRQMIQILPTMKDDHHEFLEKIKDLEQSEPDVLLQRIPAIRDIFLCFIQGLAPLVG